MDSVKILRSYDYCHFEITMDAENNSIVDNQTGRLERIDNTRKEAMRLADKAVEQYKIARAYEAQRINAEGSEGLRREVKIIKENFPQSEWTPEQKAKVKTLEQHQYILSRRYDYEDDWDDWEVDI